MAPVDGIEPPQTEGQSLPHYPLCYTGTIQLVGRVGFTPTQDALLFSTCPTGPNGLRVYWFLHLPLVPSVGVAPTPVQFLRLLPLLTWATKGFDWLQRVGIAPTSFRVMSPVRSLYLPPAVKLYLNPDGGGDGLLRLFSPPNPRVDTAFLNSSSPFA